MALLNKADLLKAPVLRRKLVTFGDGEVWIGELSVGEQRRLRARYRGEGEEAEFRSALSLMAHALRDEDGKPLLTEEEIPEMVAVLEGGAAERVGDLALAFGELNGLEGAALKEAAGN